MAIGDVIVGIDIGSSKVGLVVGEVNNFNQVQIICNTKKKSSGIQKGEIVDENALAGCISELIKEAQKEISVKINSAYITIPGRFVTIVQNSVEKEAKDKYSGISSRDIQQALIQASNIEVPEGKQVIDIVTNNFVLDNGKSTNDPVGAFSNKFTLNAQIILGEKDYLRQLYNVFKKANVDIDGIVPITLAEKNIILDEADQKDSVMLIDIGAQNTDYGIFDGQNFIYTNGIPVGGQSITNDLSIVLDISGEEAEKIKKQYNLALKSYIENDQDVILNSARGDKKVVKSSNVVEIIEARVEQIFDLINKDITSKGLKTNINTVILAGEGITNIGKSDIVAKITFNIPVKMASNKAVEYTPNAYITAFGLVRYIASRPFTKNVSSSYDVDSKEGVFKKILSRIKEFFYS